VILKTIYQHIIIIRDSINEIAHRLLPLRGIGIKIKSILIVSCTMHITVLPQSITLVLTDPGIETNGVKNCKIQTDEVGILIDTSPDLFNLCIDLIPDFIIRYIRKHPCLNLETDKIIHELKVLCRPVKFYILVPVVFILVKM